MKINWGTAIVLAFAAFISFILFFVLWATLDTDLQHQMVVEDYYKKELEVQDEINAQRNVVMDRMEPQIKKIDGGLVISFPENLAHSDLTGQVSLYRPSNKHLDFNVPLTLSDSQMLVPDDRLLSGRWDLRVAWRYNGKPYLFKKKLTY